MKTIIRGAVAGLAGTTVMTLAMLPLNKTGMAPGELAPKEITQSLTEKLGVREWLTNPALEASWRLLHFGYGTASGVGYAIAREKAFDRGRPFLIGPSFGLLLWAAGYCVWLPAFGLYPLPTRLSKRKVRAELITTHLIYGTVTAATHRVLRSKAEAS